MPMATEVPTGRPDLVTSREPVGPVLAGAKGTPGDRAFMDALAIVIAAWLVLFLIAFSLRKHTV